MEIRYVFQFNVNKCKQKEIRFERVKSPSLASRSGVEDRLFILCNRLANQGCLRRGVELIQTNAVGKSHDGPSGQRLVFKGGIAGFAVHFLWLNHPLQVGINHGNICALAHLQTARLL